MCGKTQPQRWQPPRGCQGGLSKKVDAGTVGCSSRLECLDAVHAVLVEDEREVRHTHAALDR